MTRFVPVGPNKTGIDLSDDPMNIVVDIITAFVNNSGVDNHLLVIDDDPSDIQNPMIRVFEGLRCEVVRLKRLRGMGLGWALSL